MAWVFLWELGIKSIGPQPNAAFQYVNGAKDLYEKLLEDCKDDPTLAAGKPLYGIAVAEETLAGQSEADLKEQLDRALNAYMKVYEVYPKSAHAVESEKRAEELGNAKDHERIERFYRSLQSEVRDFLLMHGLQKRLTPPKK